MQLTLHRIHSTHRYTCIYIYINTHVFKASNNQCDDLKRNKGQRTSTPELGQRAFCTWSCSTNMPSPSSKTHTHTQKAPGKCRLCKRRWKAKLPQTSLLLMAQNCPHYVWALPDSQTAIGHMHNPGRRNGQQPPSLSNLFRHFESR